MEGTRKTEYRTNDKGSEGSFPHKERLQNISIDETI
jgi:hypothetical protein